MNTMNIITGIAYTKNKECDCMNLLHLLGNVFIYTIAICLVVSGIINDEINSFILACTLVLLSETIYLRRMVKELKDKLEKGE